MSHLKAVTSRIKLGTCENRRLSWVMITVPVLLKLPLDTLWYIRHYYWQFSLFLLWKWNNNYSETKQCEESSRKTAKTRQLRDKGTLKNKLTHSKRFDHVRLMTSCPSFGHEINCQVKHYSTANFLCRVIKGWLSTALGLVSRLSRSCSLPP